MKTFSFIVFLASGALAVPISNTTETPLWIRSGKWQGDIMLTPHQAMAVGTQRNGVVNTWYRWPDTTVPYKFRAGDFNSDQANRIRNALEQYNTRTCLTVREATASDTNYVLVTREDTGCWSYIGKIGGEQRLNLQDNQYGTCLSSGTIVHEFMHAVGFQHQQGATNRDDYVTILWENIQSGLEYAFNKYSASEVTDFGVSYDYLSVMHYGKYAFSKNGQPTILAHPNPNQELGNDKGLTDKDVLKINRMYGC